VRRKAEEMLRHVLALSREERAEIAGALLWSPDPPAEAGVEEAWRREVARRVAWLEAGEETVPWSRVREELRTRLRGLS
jgi:putative addiction module component (TIGR02574 family)